MPDIKNSSSRKVVIHVKLKNNRSFTIMVIFQNIEEDPRWERDRDDDDVDNKTVLANCCVFTRDEIVVVFNEFISPS